MKRFLMIAAGLLAGCWGLMGQDPKVGAESIGEEAANVPADSVTVLVLNATTEGVAMDDVTVLPDSAGVYDPAGIYWMDGDLKKKVRTIKYLDQKLTFDQRDQILMAVGGPDMVQDWHKFATMRGWGLGTTIGGSVLFVTGACVGGIYILAGVIGTIFVAIGGQEAVDKLWADMGTKAAVGGYIMLAGTASLATGIVLLSVSNHNMRKMVRTCNAAGQPMEANLSFGPTYSGGIGLTYNF